MVEKELLPKKSSSVVKRKSGPREVAVAEKLWCGQERVEVEKSENYSREKWWSRKSCRMVERNSAPEVQFDLRYVEERMTKVDSVHPSIDLPYKPQVVSLLPKLKYHASMVVRRASANVVLPPATCQPPGTFPGRRPSIGFLCCPGIPTFGMVGPVAYRNTLSSASQQVVGSIPTTQFRCTCRAL
jgi:hypothetical protein